MKLFSFEKRIVLVFKKPKSKILDVLSSTISCVPFLALLWVVFAIVIFNQDFIIGTVLIVALIIVFGLHFIISEGIFKFGAKKLKLDRKRPYVSFPEEIKGIGRKFSDSSFPSSHIAAMVGGLFVTVYFFPQFLFGSILVVLIMCWSRLRNGMHYPTDILAGILLGLFYGWAALQILKFII